MTDNRPRLNQHLARLERLWASLDALFADLSPADWARPHGPDWTLADVPYHLAYFDRDIITDPIRRGPELPPEDRTAQMTLADMNAWNVRRFAERPPDLTVEAALALMRASRTELRAVAAGLSDADLDRRAWCPLVSARGWRTVDDLLGFCLAHAWNEFMQARLHAGRDVPESPPEATHAGLDLLIRLNQVFFTPDPPAGARFTMVWELVGEGGGVWTLSVLDGAASVDEVRAPASDLTLTLSPATFVRFFNRMADPAQLFANGDIVANHPARLADYAALFTPGGLDQTLRALP